MVAVCFGVKGVRIFVADVVFGRRWSVASPFWCPPFFMFSRRFILGVMGGGAPGVSVQACFLFPRGDRMWCGRRAVVRRFGLVICWYAVRRCFGAQSGLGVVFGTNRVGAAVGWHWFVLCGP